MVPINPLSIPDGQPGATASPAAAPGRDIVDSAHPPGAILAKSSTLTPATYVGTVAESTATTVCVPVSNATIPAPADRFRVLRNARRSMPPLASQTPFVAVRENNGIEPAG